LVVLPSTTKILTSSDYFLPVHAIKASFGLVKHRSLWLSINLAVISIMIMFALLFVPSGSPFVLKDFVFGLSGTHVIGAYAIMKLLSTGVKLLWRYPEVLLLGPNFALCSLPQLVYQHNEVRR